MSLQTMQLIGFALVISVAVVLLWIGTREMTKDKARRVADPPDLTADEVYGRFHATSGLPQELVVATLRSVAMDIEMPEAKLRSGDRFDEELKAVLASQPRRLATKAGVPIYLRSIRTVDDYIRCRISLEVAVARRG